jgi:methylenetetrahydrofolate reductase (NADPH)
MTNLAKALPGLSFEFFPPHNPEASLRLWRSVERLAPLAPRFVSVTFGAGGTTRDRTVAAIQTIVERARLNVAGHLTCVGASRAETLEVARAYARLGVRRIVALRGDPPKGAARFEPHPDGFADAAELVAALRGVGGFEIAVAAYPEKHPEAASLAADIDNLKRKIDAGASSAITQFFFETEDFLRFRDACAKAGVAAPIVPGVLPVENFGKMVNFAKRCHAAVPDWMHKAFGRAETEADAHLLAVSVAAEQCDALISEGVGHLHVYTLNNPDLTFDLVPSARLRRGAAGRGGGRGGLTGRRSSDSDRSRPTSAATCAPPRHDSLAHRACSAFGPGSVRLRWRLAPVRRPERKRRARRVELGPAARNRAAPAWAGAATRLPRGRQARPDLSTDKPSRSAAALVGRLNRDAA